MTDRDLLVSFQAIQDEEAFEALLRRYGPMVLRICRNILNDPDAADDAFQTTFLVLVRRSHEIREPDALGGWLHGVATRVAIRARVNLRRQGLHEATGLEVASMPADDHPTNHDLNELRPILHAEIERLPSKLRRAIILCYLDGKSYETVARDLCLPLGTLKGRLSRGRELLRSRLARRGVTASALSLLFLLSEPAPAISSELIATTVDAANFHLDAITRDVRPVGLRARRPMLNRPGLIVGLLTLVVIGASFSSIKAAVRRHPVKPNVAINPIPNTVTKDRAGNGLAHCVPVP